jgi:hypothetical protein
MDIWIPAVSSLVGVLVGALLASYFELWRRALDGQAAARLIRVETLENRTRAEKLIQQSRPGLAFAQSAWTQYRLIVAPLLGEIELSKLGQSYAALGELEAEMQRYVSEQRAPLPPEALQSMALWLGEVEKNARTLRKVEEASPQGLVIRLVRRRRVATEDEVREAFGLGATPLEEMRRSQPSAQYRSREDGDIAAKGGAPNGR